MAYEKSESDIMRRPPRNPKTDKIVNKKIMGYAYAQIGIMQTLAGYLTYFVVFGENGFYPRPLYDGLGEFDNYANTDLLDSYGQEWVSSIEYQAKSFITVGYGNSKDQYFHI